MNSDAPSVKVNPVNPTKTTTALLALLIAGFVIAFAGILIRLSENEIGPTATIFNRFWIVTILFGLSNQFRSRQNNASQEEFPSKSLSNFTLLLAAGILFPLSQISWAWSLSYTSVTLSTLLHSLTPLFVCLVGWIVLGKRYNHKFIFGMFVAIGGCVLIGWNDLQTATLRWQGDGIAVISAIFHAGYILVVERLRATVKTMTLLFWVCVLGTLVSFPIVLITEDKIFPVSFQGWLIVITLALVCQGLGQGLLAYSLNQLSGGLVALFSLSEPILTGILAWLIFAERLNLTTATAFILIMLGLYLAVSSSSAINLRKAESTLALSE